MALLKIPKPKSFLGFISLRSASELIFLTLLFNKTTGLYGILALFTGYTLNILQLSHYTYCLLVLALVAYLLPALKTPARPLAVLSLAGIFVIDSLVNSVYTSLFGASWFIILSQHLNDSATPGSHGPGAGTINDTAGFTDPEHDVSQVDVVATPAPGVLSGQDAVAVGSQNGSLGGAVFQSGSLASLTVISALWLIRIYFCLIVMAYARGVTRSYILTTSSTYTHSEDPSLAENPFREGREEGQGWQGRLGRALLKFPSQRYWLGRDENEDEWVRSTQGRFTGKRGLRIKVPEPGVGERERRARSGTGPPLPVPLKDRKVPA